MSAAHDRARRREKQMAAELGTVRTAYRPRYVSAPDAAPIRLPNGMVLQPESKSREKLPKWLLEAVEQARKYMPGAVPLVVVAELGGDQLALLPLKDFARIAGIQEPKLGEQLVLGEKEAE